jgi:hypothetical protein
VLVDESGSHHAGARDDARAPQGPRAYGATPRNRGRPVTMVGALGGMGVVAAMRLEGCMEGAAFLVCGQEGLAAQRRPGQVVGLDHLKAHQVAGVQHAIAAVGARVLSVPPYAPECSPREACWSTVSTSWRTQAARTVEPRGQAMAEASAAITSHEAKGWFAHAG